MSETKKAQTVMFVGRHEQRITEDLVRDLLHRLRPGNISNTTDQPLTDKELEAKIAMWATDPSALNVRMYYPPPLRPGESFRSSNVEIVASPQPFHSLTRARTGEVIRIPLYEQERGKWFEISVGRTRLEHYSSFDMAFFFEKVHRTFPVFQPNFGFADVEPTALKNMGGDPRMYVWPVLLYGPALVNKLGGRERLLEAPVWRVDELEGDRVWLQVAENPFEATEKQLGVLAKYLGLEARME